MQKYRKSQSKKKKLGPSTPSTSRIGKLTDPMVQRRQAAEKRSLTSKTTTTVKTPKPVEPKTPAATGSSTNTRKPKTTPKPAAVKESVKPEATGSGIKGKFRKVGDPGPSVTKSRSSGGGRSGAKRRSEDPRARSVSRNLREAAASRARRERKEAFSMSKAYKLPPKPPANPKEGDMYKRPFGPVMIYKNGRFTRIK
jgi:hypothetical protein